MDAALDNALRLLMLGFPAALGAIAGAAGVVGAARDTVEHATAGGAIFATVIAIARVGAGGYFAWRWWQRRQEVPA